MRLQLGKGGSEKKVETTAVVMSKVGGDRIDLGSCEAEVDRGLIETNG